MDLGHVWNPLTKLSEQNSLNDLFGLFLVAEGWTATMGTAWLFRPIGRRRLGLDFAFTGFSRLQLRWFKDDKFNHSVNDEQGKTQNPPQCNVAETINTYVLRKSISVVCIESGRGTWEGVSWQWPIRTWHKRVVPWLLWPKAPRTVDPAWKKKYVVCIRRG